MNIGQAARMSGVSAKMIRYYEQSGLLPAPSRLASGYRDYSDNDLHRLRFVRHARDLGFDVAQIGELLSLWGDQQRASADVHALTLSHINRLREKAAGIERMIAVLQELANCCQRDASPHCPILEQLAADNVALPVPTAAAAKRPQTCTASVRSAASGKRTK